MKRVVVLSAGLRQPSSTRMLADRIAEAVARDLDGLGDPAEVSPIELRDHAREALNNLLVGFPSPEFAELLDQVSGADALILVTPTFGATYNSLVKLFIDVLDEKALAGKPVLIAASGGTGRHSMMLDHAVRPLLTYLHAVVMPTGVFAAPEDWGAGHTTEGNLRQRIDRAAAELAAEVHRREPAKAYDMFAETPDFETLMGQ
ncbi:FMN reductase [Actinoplanes solisilvae]|uniref:FMN reductase n=1 Tax=Actinoplanes solisilvae TaxID=2486853 RepID=UPI000FDA19F3|nr:FMN reductase [Actinoplanes solisilvae]